jgi:hypothetical protein
LSWLKWWKALQPKWRVLDDGNLRQDIGEDSQEWEGLHQGGRNGIFMIIIALSWWVEGAAEGGLGDGEINNTGSDLHNAVSDLTQVIQCMANVPAMAAKSQK